MGTLSRSRPVAFISAVLSDKTLTKKASLNAAASMLEYACSLLVGFFLTPFMVVGLGDYSFGLWQILNRLVGYLTPASGRPTFALKWTLANQQASDDYEKKRRYVGSALIVWLIFLPILLGLGGAVSWLVPGWIRAPSEYVWTIRIVSMLLVANIIVTSLSSIPQAVLQGLNMGYKRMGASAGLVLLSGAFVWMAVYLKTGIVGVSFAVLLGTIVTGLFFLSIIHRFAPWFGAARPQKTDLGEMLGRSWWFLAWNLVTSLLLASDVVVLGFFDSVVSVTNYSLTKYVPEMMIAIILNTVFAIVPGLGGIVGSGDFRRAMRLRSEINSLIWLVATGMGATILLWNRAFMGLWVGSERYSGALPQLLIVVGVVQLVFIRSDANVIDLTLHLSQKVLVGLLSVTVSIIAASLLVGYFRLGVVGLCLGTISGRLLLSVGYPLLISRFLEVSFHKQLGNAIRPLVVMMCIFGAAFAADSLVPTVGWPGAQSWAGFFTFAGSSGLAILGFCFFAGLTTDQRLRLLQRLRMAYSRADDHGKSPQQ